MLDFKAVCVIFKCSKGCCNISFSSLFFLKLDLRSPLALWPKVHLGVNEDDVSIFLY